MLVVTAGKSGQVLVSRQIYQQCNDGAIMVRGDESEPRHGGDAIVSGNIVLSGSSKIHNGYEQLSTPMSLVLTRPD